MSWTTLAAIICIPFYLWVLKRYAASPLESLARKHLPANIAKILTKERGDGP